MYSGLPDRWPLPRACTRCGCEDDGVLGSDRSLRCSECGLFVKWVAKRDLGLAASDKRTRPDIKPSKRAAILAAFNHTCVNCHRDDRPLEIGHLISDAEGHAFDMTDAELYDELNLAPFCDACNAGQGDLTVGLPLMIKCLRIGIARRDGTL